MACSTRAVYEMALLLHKLLLQRLCLCDIRAVDRAGTSKADSKIKSAAESGRPASGDRASATMTAPRHLIFCAAPFQADGRRDAEESRS